MKVGDLVKCRFFHKFGIITREPEYAPQRQRSEYGTSMKDLVKEAQWAWVLWDNGTECKWKTNYLEVVSEDR